MLTQKIISEICQEHEFLKALRRKKEGLTIKELLLVYHYLTGKYKAEVAQLSPSETAYLFKHLCEALL